MSRRRFVPPAVARDVVQQKAAPRHAMPPPVAWSGARPAAIVQAKPPAPFPAPPFRQTALQRASEAKSSDPWPPGAESHSTYADMSTAGYGTAKKFGDFSGAQRTLILAHNRKKNKGKLKSDASNDPHQDLVEETGSKNSAEIDHIIPKSSGGANHYLNARVISWQLNNSEERVVDYSKKSWHS